MSKKRQTNEIPAKTKSAVFLNASAQSSFNLMFELQSYDEILDPSVEQLLNADL